MKNCSYCGRENEMQVGRCRECGTEFLTQTAEPITSKVQAEPCTEPERSDPEPDVLPNEECALCPSCLFPNIPDADWCKRCGAPINATSSIAMPQAAQTVGFVFRRALTGYPRPIVFIGIWLVFSAKILLTLFFLAASVDLAFTPPELLVLLCAGMLNIGISAYALHRITKNLKTIPKPIIETPNLVETSSS